VLIKTVWNEPEKDISELLQSNIDVNLIDDQGRTAFFCACERGNTAAIKALYGDYRVHINIRNMHSVTPLAMLCQKKNQEMIFFLLANGREIDVKAKNDDDETAISIATNNQLPTVVTWLSYYLENEFKNIQEFFRKEAKRVFRNENFLSMNHFFFFFFFFFPIKTNKSINQTY